MPTKSQHPETIVLHAGYRSDPTTTAVAVPIYQTTSYQFNSTEHAANLFALKELGNIYTRIMNPTQAVLEERVAAFEGGVAALALASGQAASLFAVQNICHAGDNFICSTDIYGGTWNLFQNTMSTMGIECRFVDPADPENFRRASDAKTRCYYGETLPNPKLTVFPIAEVAKIGRELGIPLIMDNTACPVLCRPIEHGAAPSTCWPATRTPGPTSPFLWTTRPSASGSSARFTRACSCTTSSCRATTGRRGYRRPGLKVALVPSNKERKSTGSYFTPQHIVKYIVAQTVGPLLDEKFAAAESRLRNAQRAYADRRRFEHAKADKLRRQPPTDDTIALWILDDYEGLVWDLFDVKVLDPAMGSGHFLVETVDFITDRVLEFLAGFPWNPVQVLIDRRIRRQILESLDAQGVKVNEERLTDVNLIKRLVMKRCVYGVDLNPMAVELAKVSLWLDSFTLGAPLSFLDHHLKCGNSLIGATIEDLKKAVQGWMYGIPMEPLERATRNMEKIADLADATLTEVVRSAETYKEVLSGVRGYRELLDCLVAEHFGVEGGSNLVKHGQLTLDDWDKTRKQLSAGEREALDQAVKLSEQITCFHWDIDFPDVFFTPRRSVEGAEFDGVVGNPPWGGLRSLGNMGSWLAPRLQTAKKGTDYFAMFVEIELSLLRDGGLVGAVLSSGWQTADESTVFRCLLEESGSLMSFVSLPYEHV